MKTPTARSAQERALSRSELVRVIAELPELHRALAAVWAEVGARPSEMFGLRVRSFDPSRCALRIEEQARSTRELKNDWTTRTVKLSEQACAILTAHIERYCANDPGAPMFPTMPGGRTEHNLWNFRNRVWAPAVEGAGIGRRVRLYDIRHKSATLSLNDGQRVAVVSRRLGHKNTRTTLTISSGATDEEQEQVANRGDLLFGDLLAHDKALPAGDGAQ